MLVTLLPGANRDNVLGNLTWALNEASSRQSSSFHPVDRYNEYIKWAVESIRLLRGQIDQASLERVVMTRTYWALLGLGSVGIEATVGLVAAELAERVSMLEDVVKSLAAEFERWSRKGVLVVGDTSFFIHHPDKIEDLDLRPILKIREESTHLLLPIAVIDELDELKQSKDKHVRWRSRHALAEIDRALPDPTAVGLLRPEDFSGITKGMIPRGAMTLEIVLDPPGHTRLPIVDDELVDRAVAIQTLAARPVTLITYDTGQSTRGRAAGLKVVKIAQPPGGLAP